MTESLVVTTSSKIRGSLYNVYSTDLFSCVTILGLLLQISSARRRAKRLRWIRVSKSVSTEPNRRYVVMTFLRRSCLDIWISWIDLQQIYFYFPIIQVIQIQVYKCVSHFLIRKYWHVCQSRLHYWTHLECEHIWVLIQETWLTFVYATYAYYYNAVL